jgi:ABC-type nitrate/sulfonate/bicarbonate transport system permease component
MRGMTFGLTLWTTALMAAMCMRLGWARYVLIALLVAAIIAIGLTVLMMTSQSANALPEPVHEALGGLGLYAVALIPLGASHSLRRFLAPRQAGR